MDTDFATDINLANISIGYGILASATPAPVTIPQCYKECIIITSDDSGTQGYGIRHGIKNYRFIDPSVQSNAVQNVISKIQSGHFLDVTHEHNKSYDDKSNTVGRAIDAFINVSGYYNTDGTLIPGTGEPCYVIQFNSNITEQERQLLQRLHLSTEFRNSIIRDAVAQDSINSVIPKGSLYKNVEQYEISRLALVSSPRSGHALDTPTIICNSDTLVEHEETNNDFFNNQMNTPESMENASVKNNLADIEAVAKDMENNDELEQNSDSVSSDAVLDVLQSIDSTLKAMLAIMPSQVSISQNSAVEEKDEEKNDITEEVKEEKPNNERLESESAVQNNIFDDPDEGKGCRKTTNNDDSDDDSEVYNSAISEKDELSARLNKMFVSKAQSKKPNIFSKFNI